MQKKIIYIALLLAAVIVFPCKAMAKPTYLSTFCTTYGTSATVLNTCNLCHPGGNTGNFNGYANDFAANGHNFKTIEPLDSDGDGYTNIVEIQARTFPGDPASQPAAAKVSVPNVVGQTQTDAGTALTTAGLVVGTVTTQSSATVSSGSVISQNPASGASVASGSAVNLVVSSGPPSVAPVSVPNVVGRMQTAATTALTKAGLVVGTVTPQSSTTVRSGSVISQDPSSGASVASGSGVNLVVSSGPGSARRMSGVKISAGPASVMMNSTGTYTATVVYNDGTSEACTPAWSVSPAAYATIDPATGVLTAKAVIGNHTVKVKASYAEAGVAKTATKPVKIIGLSKLVIAGPAKVVGNNLYTYTATVFYGDGTSKSVAPAWSLLGSAAYATIDPATGVLTANQVTANHPVTVKAAYTDGVTKMASKVVTIAKGAAVANTATVANTAAVAKSSTVGNVAPASSAHLIYSDDFSLCNAGGCPNWETIAGAWTGKPGALRSSEEQNDIILVMNIPGLEQFGAGRLESKIGLTGKVGSNTLKGQTVTVQPNGSIIFGYVDSSHYRYAAIQSNHVYIGQVGDYEGETQGTKAVGNVVFLVGQWHRLRVDIQPTGEVSVFVDPQGGATDRAAASYSFGKAASGRVGYSANKARSWFAGFYAWDTGALPAVTSPGMNNN